MQKTNKHIFIVIKESLKDHVTSTNTSDSVISL